MAQSTDKITLLGVSLIMNVVYINSKFLLCKFGKRVCSVNRLTNLLNYFPKCTCEELVG